MAADLTDYLALKAEIEQIGRDIRSGIPASTEAKYALGQRISKALDKFESLVKSETYRTLAQDEEPEAISDDPEMPSQILAKRAGRPGTCDDCGEDDCVCFSHLPRPKITVRPDRMVKIEFPVEYTTTDKLAWLKGMKLAIAKRKGK